MKIKTYRPTDASTPLSREDQLAWSIAVMASEEWDVDSEVDAMVGNRIIDSAGVAVAAFSNTSVAIARAQALAHPSPRGANLIGLGHDLRFDPEWAAWANAVAVRELDFHDTILAAEVGHPSDAIPAILAVAQHVGRTGRDLIRAIAVSYEVQLRLSENINLSRHKIDHMAHLGPSIAAGIGALLRLDAETIYQAVQFSAHTSTFTRQGRKGDLSSWKAFAPALVGRTAITAVDRAMRGANSPTPVWEGDFGIMAILLGGKQSAYQVRLPSGPEPRRGILSTFTKEYAVAYHANPFIDLAKRIRGRISLKEIESIEIHSKWYTHMAMGSGSGDPQKYSPHAARETLDHSLMYVFAVVLEDGELHHFDSYSRERSTRPETVELWRKIKTVDSPKWNARFDNEPDPLKKPQGGNVVIRMKSGAVIEDEILYARAHPLGEVPFERADYRNKAAGLFKGNMSEAEIGRLFDLVDHLPELRDSDLLALNPICDLIDVDAMGLKPAGLY